MSEFKHNAPKGIHVYFIDNTQRTFKCSLIGGDEEDDDIKLKDVDRSCHTNIKLAKWGYGKLKCVHTGDIGPSAEIYGCIYEDDSFVFELAILNDSLKNPIGRIDGRLVVIFNGTIVYDNKVTLYDETGCAFRFNNFKFAPRADLLDPILAELPDITVDEDTLRGWTRQYPDPDPVHNTHQTGSPRNKLLDLGFAVYKYSNGNQEHTKRLHDWVLAQIGMKANFEDRFINGRPHWITDDDTGEIWDYDKFYNIDGNEEWPLFGENGIIVKPYKDSFGRIRINPDLLHRGSRTAYDIEHLEVETLFAAAVLLGSEFAYRGVEMIAQEQLDKTYEWNGLYSRSFFHSSRTMGWGVRALIRAYQLTGKEKYLNAYRSILENCFTGEWTNKMGKDFTKDDFPMKWVQTRSSGHIGFWDQPIEACWQAAITGSTCWLAARVDPNPEWRKRFEEWGIYVADCIHYCYTPEGYYENYGIQIETETNSKLPAFKDGEITWIGTRFWVLDCMTRAWLKTGYTKYEEAAKTHWEALKNTHAGGWYLGRPSCPIYHQWYWVAAKYIDTHT